MARFGKTWLFKLNLVRLGKTWPNLVEHGYLG